MPRLPAASEVTGHSEGRPPTPPWISRELIELTQRTWSPLYGRPIPRDEAIEMLMNVKRLAETWLRHNR